MHFFFRFFLTRYLYFCFSIRWGKYNLPTFNENIFSTLILVRVNCTYTFVLNVTYWIYLNILIFYSHTHSSKANSSITIELNRKQMLILWRNLIIIQYGEKKSFLHKTDTLNSKLPTLLIINHMHTANSVKIIIKKKTEKPRN